jgi:hypothetical protein
VIAYLSTRVRNPNQNDWNKLVRMMTFLIQTKEDILTIELVIKDGNKIMAEWYVDASFAVHPNFKSHTGVAMSAGKGAIITVSRKQNINTRSFTEAELVGGDDAMGPLIWTDNFLRCQGYDPG